MRSSAGPHLGAARHRLPPTDAAAGRRWRKRASGLRPSGELHGSAEAAPAQPLCLGGGGVAAILGPQFAASGGGGALSDLTSHGPQVARSIQNHQTPGAQKGLDPVESGESEHQA